MWERKNIRTHIHKNIQLRYFLLALRSHLSLTISFSIFIVEDGRSTTTTFSIRRKDLCPKSIEIVSFSFRWSGTGAQSVSQSHPKQISGATNIDSVVLAFLLSAFFRRHTFPATMVPFRKRIYVRVIKYFIGMIHVSEYLCARAVDIQSLDIVGHFYNVLPLDSTFYRFRKLENCKIIKVLFD